MQKRSLLLVYNRFECSFFVGAKTIIIHFFITVLDVRFVGLVQKLSLLFFFVLNVRFVGAKTIITAAKNIKNYLKTSRW